VVHSGELKWQDQLNENNVKFFEASDAIFTNYCWKEEYPFNSAKFAKERKRDVYMGCDIFGRNTFGGGGFDLYKALKVIKEAETSVAIFAPGWTYEKFEKSEHLFIDDKFWLGKDSQLGVAHFIPPRVAPSLNNVFYSNFDRGFGEQLAINGKIVQANPFANLSRQSTGLSFFPKEEENLKMGFSTKKSYNGETSLHISTTRQLIQSYIPLFKTDFVALNTVKVSLAMIPFVSEHFQTLLQLTTNDGEKILLGNHNLSKSHEVNVVSSFQTERWISQTFSLNLTGVIAEIGLLVVRMAGELVVYDGECFLGEVKIWNDAEFPKMEIASDCILLTESPITKLQVSDILVTPDKNLPETEKLSYGHVTLSWQCDPAFRPSHYNIYLNESYFGTAFCERFRVSGLPLESDGMEHKFEFMVEPVNVLGFPLSRGSCSTRNYSLTLSLEDFVELMKF